MLAQSNTVLVLEKIATELPQLPQIVKRKLNGFTLADPTFDIPGPIGADLFARTLLSSSISLGDTCHTL